MDLRIRLLLVIKVYFCFHLTTYANECHDARQADIIFALDGSGSVGTSQFIYSLNFVSQLIDAFPIGPSATQVALIIFDSSASKEFDLNTYHGVEELKRAIIRTEYPGGGTHIPAAFYTAAQMFQTSSPGRRESATGIFILLTDGRSIDNIQESIFAALTLKIMGIFIYTAGVGSGVNVEELQGAASNPSYYFNTISYDSLQNLAGPITMSACEDLDGCFCYNGGTCTARIIGNKCECPAIYTGYHCETPICDASSCRNGGVCVVSGGNWSCHCQPGYTGLVCETDIDECQDSPCQNGATCRDWVNAFSCDCPPKYYGILCETGICQPSVADLVFVLDSSASQTKEEFGKQLEFINKFIDRIVIGERNLQVAVVTYSFEAVTEISLGQYTDNIALKDAIRQIKYRPGATFTNKGLEKAKEIFDSTSRKRPFDHVAKRYAFVLTDGMSTNRRATAEAARRLKTTINHVIAIGIGKEVSHQELINIASTENTGRKFVYSVQNFDALYTVIKELVHLTCDECSWKTSSDIVFLLDMSAKILANDFQTGLNAITFLTDKTSQMETENNTVRIALVTYGVEADAHLYRGLNDEETKHVFLFSIQKLVQSDGYCLSESSSCDKSKLLEALNYTDKHIFNTTKKSGTREIVIVLSDGHDHVSDEMKAVLDRMIEKGRSIYSIALGEGADISNLQNIVGDPALVFSVYDYSTIKILDALTTEFFFYSCDLSNDFLDGV